VVLSCSKDYDLQKSIFIPDKSFPDLPAYSEWGYNTFGAYFDRDLFIYNDYDVPVKVINTEGKTSFILRGQKGNSNYYAENMSVSFDLYGFNPSSYQELVLLDDSVIDLTSPLCKVIITIDTIKTETQILNGNLTFKRIQNLMVDKQNAEVIVSGTFEFQTFYKGEPVSLTNGRFDVGVGNDNFFKY
jgi:hypothetical protein